MTASHAHKLAITVSTVALLSVLPAPAHALQPLQTFVESARIHNPKLIEAGANADQSEANEGIMLGRILPGIQLRGSYVRNQYQAALPAKFFQPDNPNIPADATVAFIPYNQYSGTGTINVPLIDLAAFTRLASAKSSARGSREQREAIALQVEATVTQGYYQLLANIALETSSQHALEVAQRNLQLTDDRFSAGSAAKLDVDRAKADVERQFQQLSDVKLQVALAARNLESLTAVAPEMGQEDANRALEDDLHAEGGLTEFQPKDQALPSVHAAMLNTEAALRTTRASKLSLVPALSGSFQEAIGNTPNFADKTMYYTLTLALTWNFDYTSIANINVSEAAEVAARARETQARLDANDALFHYWKTVETYIVRSRSAREQARVSAEAASLAQDRYAAGTATQLDLLQAQRDAFAADASRIQADADLINSRVQLRFAAGQHYGK